MQMLQPTRSRPTTTSPSHGFTSPIDHSRMSLIFSSGFFTAILAAARISFWNMAMVMMSSAPFNRIPISFHYHGINPDRPVVIAMMQGAVQLLHEYRSMAVTCRSGLGFSNAVRQRRNGWILPGVNDPLTQASLELGPVGPMTPSPLLCAIQSSMSSPYRRYFITDEPSS